MVGTRMYIQVISSDAGENVYSPKHILRGYEKFLKNYSSQVPLKNCGILTNKHWK